MEQFNNTTTLIGMKDKNITLNKALKHETHIELIATLDYQPPKCKYCKGIQIKYDFQKPSKIPFIQIAGFPSLIRLKKRRFQCKACRKVTVAETSLVKKNCQISEIVRRNIAQLLLNREALTHIASKLAISTSTVYRKLKQFQFTEDYTTLPQVLSWDEFSYQKGKLAFIAQDYDTKKIINAMELPYSNAKLEATNKLIKGIKRNAFGYRNFDNFKKHIFLALNIKREKTNFVSSRV